MAKKKPIKVSIVLGGGAVKAVFQVGVLQVLQKYVDSGQIVIDVVSGVSAGALNGALYAQGDLDILVNIWKNRINTTKDIYKHWFIPYKSFITSFFTKFFPSMYEKDDDRGLYNPAPIKKLIYETVDENKLIDSPIKFFSCSVQARSGNKIYTEAIDKNREIIKQQILASISFPFAFPPVIINNVRYVDGGLKEPIPFKVALENSARDTDCFIVISNNRIENTSVNIPKLGLMELGISYIDALYDEVSQKTLRLAIYEHILLKKLLRKRFLSPRFSSKLRDILKEHESIEKIQDLLGDQGYIFIQPPSPIRFKSSFDIKPGRIQAAMEDGRIVGYEILRKYFGDISNY